jgi:hypothetical protein
MPKHLWAKGQSGNPAGTSKERRQFHKLAQSHSVEALEKLVELMRDKKNKSVALRAAENILDRAWGKPALAITGEAGTGPVKFEVSWKSAEVGVIDITPRDEPLLLEADDA